MPRKKVYRKKKTITDKRIARVARNVFKRDTETKVFDAYEDVTVSTTGRVTLLTAVTQGVGVSQRVGERLQPVALHLKFQSTVEPTDTYNNVRYIVFKWKDDDTLIAPVMANVLGTTFGGLDEVLNEFQWTTRSNFQVLLDVTHSVDTAGPRSKITRHRLKLRGHIEYETNLTTGVGNIYLIRVSDSAVAPSPSMGVYSRLYFKDA